MSIAALIADLAKEGVSPELLGRVAAALAASAGPDPEMSAAEKRRAWDREYRRQKRVSGGKSGGQKVDAEDDMLGGIPPDIHPTSAALARVRDNPSRLVISGGTVVDVSASAQIHSDDWPTSNVVEALVAEIASPRLDPSKSPGLIATSGRLAAWKRDGASWQHDVVPVLRVACAKSKSLIATWKYFDPAIAQSIADNRRALEIPEAGQVRSTGPPTSFADKIGADNAEARRRAFEILDAREARNG